jgi:hypothetical protein
MPVSGTVRLNTVSSCDDCEEQVELPFTFYWLGKHAFSSIFVSSNGQIWIPDESNDACSNGCVQRIHVISGDLTPSTSGSIYILLDSMVRPDPEISFTVSWENISLFQNQNANISASARVFVNGTIELCWRVANDLGNSSLLAGISDPARSFFAPAHGRPFDDNGYFSAMNGSLPNNQCQRFTSSPSSSEPTPNAFQSIANAPGAVQLNPLSNCDECDETAFIIPRLAFSFRGNNRIKQVTGITISSNGYLQLECSEPLGGTYLGGTCAMIEAVAAGDFAGGSVWMVEQYPGTSTTTSTSSATKQMAAPDSMVISWEGVQLDGDPQSFINAQITLFADETGTIEICWGEAVLNGRGFSSGVRGYDRNSPNSYFPAQGPEFDSFGYSYPGMWPSNRCQRFFDSPRTRV